MGSVSRLITLVDLDHENPRQVSLSARHEAVLADGRRALLLDDRGWSFSTLRASVGDSSPPVHEDNWALTSVEEIETTARDVVGPDEPAEGRSQEDAERDHWAYLAGKLSEQGVVVDPLELQTLPHDVVLSERLLSRIGRSGGGTLHR
jgi:hypothetical protein